MRGRALLIAALLALSGCASMEAGGVAGLSVGTKPSDGRVAASIVKAMGGGLIGSIGAGLDDSDRQRGLEAEYRALEYTPSGQAVVWRGSGSTSGEVVAAAPYRVGSQDCRQYRHTLHIGGQSKEARGTACRNSDGSWTPLT